MRPERIREANIFNSHWPSPVRALAAVLGSLLDSRLQFMQPEDIVGSIDALGDAGRELEKLRGRLSGEKDAQEGDEEVIHGNLAICQ